MTNSYIDEVDTTVSSDAKFFSGPITVSHADRRTVERNQYHLVFMVA
jgi:hypothetical protein